MKGSGMCKKAAGLLLLAVIFCVSPAEAKYERELEEVNALLDDGKYESAAEYISNNSDLMEEPRFVRLYSHILTNYYVLTLNFHFFALKDLKKGERVEDYRGKEGMHKLSGSDLEELLSEKYSEDPDSPDLNFAVGEYIAIGERCGCGQPVIFTGDKGSDFPYFLKAYEGGIYDYFSLFRLGYHYHEKEDADLEKAAFFYEKSLELEPGHTATAYNLAALYYVQDKIDLARKYAEQALGKYGDNALNADTYNLHGRIEYAAGNTDIAERSLIKALELQAWHDLAFKGLLDLYRQTGQEEKYVERALGYIAVDYSNPYLFDVYMKYLADEGFSEADEKVVSALAGKEFAEPIETGTIYFFLGRISYYTGQKDLALERYRKSLEAMESLEEPPEGAIDVLKEAIAELSEE